MEKKAETYCINHVTHSAAFVSAKLKNDSSGFRTKRRITYHILVLPNLWRYLIYFTFVYFFIFFSLSGETCEEQGCPGESESCSGHGTCTIGTQTCMCDDYWKGEGCNIWDCPGEPDCNKKGTL